ncbi:hypothetical protein AAW12_24345 [Sphingobacterium sp. Ag1]|nr:hypothetical protein AAW12_24345 [Sphingobacterium sp. Ag1]
MISGADYLKDVATGNRCMGSYDILSISSITAVDRHQYLYTTKIIDLKKRADIQVYGNMDLFFFNKTLLTDPTVRVIFDFRKSDDYEFIFEENEVAHIKHLSSIIKNFQLTEDHELCEKFIANVLGHFVMYYKILRERSSAKLEAYIDNKLYKERAHRFFEDVVTYHNVNKNLSFYAQNILVSKRTLSKITKEVFGKSPKCILDNYIVEMAKAYLKQPNIPLKMVSANLGFTETSNFMTFFKKMTKLTPTEFRNRYLLSASGKTIAIFITIELLIS